MINGCLRHSTTVHYELLLSQIETDIYPEFTWAETVSKISKKLRHTFQFANIHWAEIRGQKRQNQDPNGSRLVDSEHSARHQRLYEIIGRLLNHFNAQLPSCNGNGIRDHVFIFYRWQGACRINQRPSLSQRSYTVPEINYNIFRIWPTWKWQWTLNNCFNDRYTIQAVHWLSLTKKNKIKSIFANVNNKIYKLTAKCEFGYQGGRSWLRTFGLRTSCFSHCLVKNAGPSSKARPQEPSNQISYTMSTRTTSLTYGQTNNTEVLSNSFICSTSRRNLNVNENVMSTGADRLWHTYLVIAANFIPVFEVDGIFLLQNDTLGQLGFTQGQIGEQSPSQHSQTTQFQVVAHHSTWNHLPNTVMQMQKTLNTDQIQSAFLLFF